MHAQAHAHLYACDALCHLDRSSDAEAHAREALTLVDALGGVVSTVEAPSGEGSDVEPVRNPYYEREATSLGSGKSPAADMYANLASVQVLRGDIGQAHAFVSQALSLDPTCRTALTVLVYLNLREGRVSAALDMLKKQRLSERLMQ